MGNRSETQQLSIVGSCWIIAGAFSASFGVYLAAAGTGFLYTGLLSLFVGIGIIVFKEKILEMRRKIIKKQGGTKQ
ncbi:MAG: hypothetical protein ABSD68_03805 [Candidatus Micrarchaeales archaeon]|jgi:hypothetical protein